MKNSVTRTISGGEIHQYHVSPDVPYTRLQLVKQGIDLELRVSDSRAGELLRIADWRGREGWLTVLLERSAAKQFTLEISAVSETEPPGEYVIGLKDLSLSGPVAGIRIDAERTMSQADHTRYSYYLGSGGNRKEALKQFETARDLWNRAGFPGEQARAAFSIAGIQWKLGRVSNAHQSYQEALVLWRGIGDERGIAATLNQLGLVDQDLGKQAEALEHLSEARALRERLGDTYFLAQIANNMGLIYTSLGKSRIAMKYLVQALEAQQAEAEFRVLNSVLRQEDYFQTQLANIQKDGDLLGAAIALNNLARIHSTMGEFGDALNFYENSRFLSEFLENEDDVALATLNIGQVYFQMTEHQKALDHLSMAVTFFAGPRGNPYWHSLALDNLGKVHLQLGNYQRALDLFEQALTLRTSEDNPKGRADTLQRLGEVYTALGEPVKAIEYFSKSLKLRQTAVSRYREALTLNQMGVAQAKFGLLKEALSSHEKALEIHRADGNKRGETESLVNLGRFYASQDQSVEALNYLNEALLLTRNLGDRVWEAESLFEIAKVELGLGQTHDSITHLDEALSVIDSLRGDLISPEMRASFFATQLDVHRFYIGELMKLAKSGDQSNGETAFVVAERAKQRTLLDYLANTGNTAASTDMQLLKHRETLRRDLDANQQERVLFTNKPEQVEQLVIIDKRIRDITADLERVEISISGQRAPEQQSAESVVSAAQAASLLGTDTVLLEYALGEDRSFVWVIGDGVFDVAALPSEQEITDRVRKVFAGLRTNNPSGTRSERDQLEHLGNLLLGPIAAHLGKKRLAIVPDGVLHYLPFVALGDPRSKAGESTLIQSNEIVVLPSASSLLGLRSRAASFKGQDYRVAVLADPVFNTRDPRVVPADSAAVITRDTENVLPEEAKDQLQFSRLPGTLYEAGVIQELMDPGKALLLTGFAANRGQLTDGSLNDYNVLHLATHGIVNPVHPGLSGVVLSALDNEGRKQPSFVRALDLFYMRIGARLVVLSACETALGKEIRGEGLMGLTHGFFYAGANTVVSSLWQVPDRATAELMRHFYHEMLQNERSPAAALRLAQLKIRDKRKWRDPYYWAAFVVQGDWKW